MGSRTVLVLVAILFWVSHTMGWAPGLIRGGKKGVGRYANNWLVEGDIRGAKDASQDLPAHRIRFDRRGLEQLNQSIPDGDLVLAMCPYCAAGHGSVHSIC